MHRKILFGAQIWQMANSVWRISAHKFGLHFVGEIEWQIFSQTLCAGNFLLGVQRLVKSGPGVNFINILLARFLYESAFLPKCK